MTKYCWLVLSLLVGVERRLGADGMDQLRIVFWWLFQNWNIQCLVKTESQYKRIEINFDTLDRKSSNTYSVPWRLEPFFVSPYHQWATSEIPKPRQTDIHTWEITLQSYNVFKYNRQTYIMISSNEQNTLGRLPSTWTSGWSSFILANTSRLGDSCRDKNHKFPKNISETFKTFETNVAKESILYFFCNLQRGTSYLMSLICRSPCAFFSIGTPRSSTSGSNLKHFKHN